MLEYVSKLFGQVDTGLERVFANRYASTAIMVFLILYASLAAPNLSPRVAGLFDTFLAKALMIALILIAWRYNPAISILLAVSFVLTMFALSKLRVFDYANYLTTGQLANVERAVEDKMSSSSNSPSGAEEESPEGVPALAEMGAPVDYQDQSFREKVNPADFMALTTPLPVESDPVLPSDACQRQGPQGAEAPVGFSGYEVGANYGSCGAEL